ncbi:MAG: hypothetical protein JO176_01675 [Acidimicrobiia bacterium]|nr:hypothetical protein [Acidimicrobiia bacterium]
MTKQFAHPNAVSIELLRKLKTVRSTTWPKASTSTAVWACVYPRRTPKATAMASVNDLISSWDRMARSSRADDEAPGEARRHSERYSGPMTTTRQRPTARNPS